MEDKKLNRVLDRVKLSQEREEAILASLLTEQKEVSSMKQTTRRRMPAVVLAAAVLAVVLGGTALGRGVFGTASVVPQQDGISETDGSSHSGYSVFFGDYEHIPAGSLTEEVMTMGEGTGAYGDVVRTFSSWTECEAFLGMELADNAVLEQTPQSGVSDVSVFYVEHVPRTIMVRTTYEDGGYSLMEQIMLRTEYNSVYSSADIQVGLPGDAALGLEYEDYETPSGMKVTIVTQTDDIGNIRHTAYFVKNSGLFMLDFFTLEEYWRDGKRTSLETLKEILDAYE